jgi:GAF domain-containing protein
VKDTARKTEDLGALIVGQPAKSWLGVPIQYAGQALGVIIVQDIEHEGRFTDQDERMLLTLAAQLALVIRNARLLETSRQQAEIERLVNEISAKIRRSVDIQSILRTTANELATAVGARRIHIRLQSDSEEPQHQSRDLPSGADIRSDEPMVTDQISSHGNGKNGKS